MPWDLSVLSHLSNRAFYSTNQWNGTYSDEKFCKCICPERLFIKMAFHRSCTILMNIIAEMKPIFQTGGSMLFSALVLKRTSIVVLSLIFRTLFFWKKNTWMRVLRLFWKKLLDWEFRDCNIILIALCSMIICWPTLEFWTLVRLA